MSTEAVQAVAPGSRLGAYRLVREVGRGGIGQVFLAERADGEFEQLVAVKVLKRGMDTDSVLRRFRNERQILAALDHPNIARVLDGGAAAGGQPYLVMEYIDGEPVTDHCRNTRASLERRLELMVALCDAVQYAHQRLLIHRDLKPSNVLVTATGAPKLLDFGIAKLLSPEAIGGAGWVESVEVQPMMTPAYASPEQILGEPITTATDVYGLGLLLYELLVGRPARPDGTGQTVAALRIACEADLPVPSRVLAALGAASAVVPYDAAALAGDLDTIVAVATAREQGRRYGSAEQLAADLRRHLRHEPVAARPTSWRYVAGRFVRRNSIAVAAGTLAIVGLAAGLGIATWQAHEARQARAAADRRFDELRQLTNALVFDYHDAIKELPGSTSVRAELLRDGLRVLDSLAAESGGNRQLMLDLADAYRRVSVLQGMEFVANTGDTQGALVSSGKAQRLLESLGAVDSRDPDLLARWGGVLAEQGTLHRSNDDPKLAAATLARGATALEHAVLLEPQGPARDQLATTYKRLAEVLGGSANTANLGRKQESLDYLRRSLALRAQIVRDRPADLEAKQDLALTLHSIGEWHYNAGDLPAAIEAAREALRVRRELAAAAPINQQFRRELAIGISSNGTLLLTQGDGAGALALYEEALPMYEDLARRDPGNENARRDLTLGLRDVGAALYHVARPEAGRSYFERAYPRLQAAIAAEPSFYNRRQLINTHLKHAAGAARCTLIREQTEHAREALELAEPLLQQFPDNPVARTSRATAELELAASLEAADPATARRLYSASVEDWNVLRQAGTLRGLDAERQSQAVAALARLR